MFLAAAEDHSDADCLVVIVLSHGGQRHPKQEANEKDYSDDQYSLQEIAAFDCCYDERELFKPFEGDKCPSLRTKPKIFFIQACRSDDETAKKLHSSRYLARRSDKGQITTDDELAVCSLPNYADFLIFRATVDGKNRITGDGHLCANFALALGRGGAKGAQF